VKPRTLHADTPAPGAHGPPLAAQARTGETGEVTMREYHILLADDQPSFREEAKAEIEGVEGLWVVAEATNGVELLRGLEIHSPNLVILELAILGYRGVEIIRDVKKRNRKVKFLVLTAQGSVEQLQEAIYAGAGGYLLKKGWKASLLEAVSRIRADGVFLDPKLEKSLSETFREVYAPEGTKPAFRLTKREREALGYIVEGYSNIEIGNKMAISVRTAEKHRANILKKLDTNRTTHLIKYGLRNKIIDLYGGGMVPE
jgi:DNA-binding NarL/FixJ family response regulator